MILLAAVLVPSLALSTQEAQGGGDCPNLTTIDFEGLSAGQNVTTQISGVTISADNNVGGHPDKAIIFDSGNPTGEDNDLQTPGFHASNTVAQDNILIVAEDDVDDSPSDGLVDDPDDEAGGGDITIVFDILVDTKTIKLIDIDQDEPAVQVKLFNESDTLLSTVDAAALGNNSVQTLNIAETAVKKIVVVLVSSGAFDDLVYCPFSFNVIPESPIGAIAIIGSSMAALGAFIAIKSLRIKI